ncbi:MAG: alpha/beta hydrolase-fold protein [Oscillospiraceae bacterium]|nr:alpha/beta hydrolase-fold protein [Oscillospiraceae bacterium]
MALFRTSFFSACHQRLVRANVLLPSDSPLPPGAARDWGPYKTLYLLHGYTGNCESWLTNSFVRRMAMQFNIAVVMPDGFNGFYVDQPKSGILGSEFIGKELVEFTRRTFPLSGKREDTLLAGLSMGGYGALYNGLRYGSVFGHSIALSTPVKVLRYESEHEPKDIGREFARGYFEALHGNLSNVNETDRNIALHAKQVFETGQPVTNLYIACGYNDSLVPENRELHENLCDIGFPHVYEEGPGTHDWPFFNDYLYKGLVSALGEPELAPHPFWVEKTDYVI